jgi:hypothetical protein
MPPLLTIRREQMKALVLSRVDVVEDRALAHLRSHFPEQVGVLDEAACRQVIRESARRAAAAGLESEHGILVYLNLVFSFGRHFDERQAWARSALAPGTEPKGRIEALSAAALTHEASAVGLSATDIEHFLQLAHE